MSLIDDALKRAQKPRASGEARTARAAVDPDAAAGPRARARAARLRRALGVVALAAAAARRGVRSFAMAPRCHRRSRRERAGVSGAAPTSPPAPIAELATPSPLVDRPIAVARDSGRRRVPVVRRRRRPRFLPRTSRRPSRRRHRPPLRAPQAVAGSPRTYAGCVALPGGREDRARRNRLVGDRAPRARSTTGSSPWARSSRATPSRRSRRTASTCEKDGVTIVHVRQVARGFSAGRRGRARPRSSDRRRRPRPRAPGPIPGSSRDRHDVDADLAAGREPPARRRRARPRARKNVIISELCPAEPGPSRAARGTARPCTPVSSESSRRAASTASSGPSSPMRPGGQRDDGAFIGGRNSSASTISSFARDRDDHRGLRRGAVLDVFPALAAQEPHVAALDRGLSGSSLDAPEV